MAIIKTIEPNEATGKVAEIYKQFESLMGFVPNAFKVTALNPALLANATQFLQVYFQHQTLSPKLLALIRLLVSIEEKCEYCITVNSGMLMQNGMKPEEIEAVKTDPTQAPLEEKEKELLLFVLKAVRESHSTSQDDIEKLRKLGWSDKEIYEATFHGASQVASDTILNAFKIELDQMG